MTVIGNADVVTIATPFTNFLVKCVGINPMHKTFRAVYFLRILGLGFCALLSAKNLSKGFDLKQAYDQISAEDKAALDAFFRKILLKDGLALVLFDAKPMGSTTFNPSRPEWIGNPTNLIVLEGWNIWEKHRHRFPLNNYLFRVIDGPGTDQMVTILLVNREQFKAKIHEHHYDFQQALGKTVVPEQMLQDFETGSDPFRHVLRNRPLLVGIAYGYGKWNAEEFEKQDEMMRAMRSIFQFARQADVARCMGLPPISPIHYKTISDAFVRIPRFYQDTTDPETRALIDRYKRCAAEIEQAYQDRDFLEVTLEKLTR